VLMVYGALMPLRILEEIRFWKMQEKEYTMVILKLVPDLEPQYEKLLKEWEKVLSKTEKTAQQWIESVIDSNKFASHPLHSQLHSIIQHSRNQSQELIQHLFQLTQQSSVINKKPTIKTMILHMIRGSEYFLGVLIAAMESEGQSDMMRKDSDISARIGNQRDSNLSSTTEGTWSEPVTQRPVPIGGHTLPPLPYAYDALEPHIDEETMRLHHDKHHQSYVDGLNKAEKMMEEARDKKDFSLIKHWEREAAFNGSGHYLHTIFWNIMNPQGGGKATGPIAAQINKDFGSFDKFKAHFSQAAEKVEGGGWAILVWSPRSHRLEILQAEKHQNLTQWDVIPLLVLDVWEHAYYLSYQNKRDQYIEAWWNVVNWNHVNERFVKARMLKWLPY
jgi:Fe-Mn family superoxide dismutase